MSKPLCLIIDDEPDILNLLAMTLEPMGIECCRANNFVEAQTFLNSHKFNLCLTDMKLPDGNGLDIIDIIVKDYPNTPVAMLTAHGSMEIAIKALKAGAFDFISKPLDIKNLRNIISSALQLSEEEGILSYSKPLIKKIDLIGQSQVMQDVRDKIKKLARTQTPVYIKGESGTGKEIVAKMIHANGPRAKQSFVPVNCGAIPQELMENEFFGHKKGSFTSANLDKKGLFQIATGGTLFLDEVAELPLSMQVKLLRAIQEKTIRPVGSNKEITIDVRVLSATHHDLAELVKTGKFRQDLFYRINVIELYIPPLRERTEDIPCLIEHFLKKFAPDREIDISPSTMKTLKHHFFVGNVRELENILERAITFCENDKITVDDLQLSGRKNAQHNETEDELLDPLLNEIEKETLFNALSQSKNNKTKAARLLGISIGAFRYRFDKYKKQKNN
ncbi:sigma-54 dependent transcriptional regulator [Candidatus Halobeggiatoa sp. HSG11]|nr:sigma-54 dependent transcriptional regulator [Candidatus Halobeggiatoa sp. HSG11]